MVYVLKNIYKTAIWGGNNLKKLFDVDSPYDITSEIWTASAHKNGLTPITNNNEYSGVDSLYKNKKEMFGIKSRKYDEFPLLAKWIDANGKLSVQVHPDDEYAKEKHNSFGKTEAWFIVSAKDDAKIVYGLKNGTTKKDLENAISNNCIEKVLNYVSVEQGQIFYIPSGTVHALLDGVVVYEIQQSSDITYRLYDWNRVDKDGKPRELHIEQALDVINFNRSSCEPKQLDEESYDYFKIKKQDIKEIGFIEVTKESFKLCSVLCGEIKIVDDEDCYEIKAGQSFIIPASFEEIKKYKCIGNATLLESECN